MFKQKNVEKIASSEWNGIAYGYPSSRIANISFPYKDDFEHCPMSDWASELNQFLAASIFSPNSTAVANKIVLHSWQRSLNLIRYAQQLRHPLCHRSKFATIDSTTAECGMMVRACLHVCVCVCTVCVHPPQHTKAIHIIAMWYVVHTNSNEWNSTESVREPLLQRNSFWSKWHTVQWFMLQYVWKLVTVRTLFNHFSANQPNQHTP